MLAASVFILAGSAAAASRALVVVGLAADAAHAARLRAQAQAAQLAFLIRGFPADSVRLLIPGDGAPVQRDTVLAALRMPGVEPDDETWILLLGHSAPARDGRPTFQVSGPRLTADDLAAILGRLPGRKFVVIATASSGGFLPPLLALPEVEAVAATAEAGEINEPRFPDLWIEAFATQPTADFPTLARIAVGRVAKVYAEKSLALAEHAQLIDRAAGRIVDVSSVPANPSALTPR